MPSKPYKKRTDLEKLHSQWRKLSGLHTREEWSAAVIRAATAAELAANLAIRSEYKAQNEFGPEFVDSMLRWANGLIGKLDKLLKPLWVGQPIKEKHLKELRKLAETVNERRNAVVHSGEFCNQDEAEAIIEKASLFIVELVRLYKPKFALKKPSEA